MDKDIDRDTKASENGYFTMRDWALPFYCTATWKRARDVAIKRDRYLCQDCLKRGRVQAAEEVHHIVELTPENIHDERITIGLDNLVSLCRKCHRARHGAYQKRYEVDEFGHVTTVETDPPIRT